MIFQKLGKEQCSEAAEAAEALCGLETGRVGLLGGLTNCISEPATWQMHIGAKRSENLESKLWSPQFFQKGVTNFCPSPRLVHEDIFRNFSAQPGSNNMLNSP